MQVPNWSREDLQDILSDALSQAWTPAQEAVLSTEAGVESVIDAVGRVTAAAQVLLWFRWRWRQNAFDDVHTATPDNASCISQAMCYKG